MFSGMYNFVKRHRRKFIAVSVLAGGAVAASRYATKKFNEWKERQVIEYLDKMKKEQHFETTQATCNQTVISKFSEVCEHIQKEMDLDAILAELESTSNSKNKVKLWKELKLMVFGRILVEIFAASLFVLLNKVQFAILAGYLFADSQKSCLAEELQEASVMTATPKVQENYLGIANHFAGDGLSLLIDEVRVAVQSELGSISLKEKLTIMDVQTYCQNIFNIVFRQHDLEARSRFLVEVLVPQDADNTCSDVRNDLILAKMMTETLDAFDNHEVFPLVSSVVSSNFGLFYDALLPCFEAPSNDAEKPFLNPSLNNVPLAKIIPVLSNLTSSNYEIRNHFLNNTLHFTMLKSYAENIYEAFSSHCEENVSDSNHNSY